MISPPPLQTKIQDENGNIRSEWKNHHTEIFNGIRALQTSGTTAQRPVKGLYVGRPFFDTTLNRPIWYDGTIWILATGLPA